MEKKIKELKLKVRSSKPTKKQMEKNKGISQFYDKLKIKGD